MNICKFLLIDQFPYVSWAVED